MTDTALPRASTPVGLSRTYAGHYSRMRVARTSSNRKNRPRARNWTLVASPIPTSVDRAKRPGTRSSRAGEVGARSGVSIVHKGEQMHALLDCPFSRLDEDGNNHLDTNNATYHGRGGCSRPLLNRDGSARGKKTGSERNRPALAARPPIKRPSSKETSSRWHLNAFPPGPSCAVIADTVALHRPTRCPSGNPDQCLLVPPPCRRPGQPPSQESPTPSPRRSRSLDEGKAAAGRRRGLPKGPSAGSSFFRNAGVRFIESTRKAPGQWGLPLSGEEIGLKHAYAASRSEVPPNTTPPKGGRSTSLAPDRSHSPENPTSPPDRPRGAGGDASGRERRAGPALPAPHPAFPAWKTRPLGPSPSVGSAGEGLRSSRSSPPRPTCFEYPDNQERKIPRARRSWMDSSRAGGR